MSGDFVSQSFVLPHWAFWGLMVLFPTVFMVLARMRAKADAALKARDQVTLTEDIEDDAKKVDWVAPGNWYTRIVDPLCNNIGAFVSLWTVVCVMNYMFEVLARYLFSAPTNWVHEASFLMFGVMYTLGGAALFLADGHVRVDVFYSKWSRRGRAGADIVTSVISAIFLIGIFLTGWQFWVQGLDQNILPSWLAQGYNMDISQSEWQIAYWPIKFAIPLGALLVGLILVSRFVKDFQTFNHFGEADNAK
ncbi:MAG: TRAP transporter small permease subunit [Rhodospirillales bacterium]|jgi:TRAP-type mannitol/chloroaromatic compound transport system permease small subunit|nr:TRAP transporter small permease subunit [Rhodospirillales bacterium]